MRRDSDMTEYLLLRLAKRGIVTLPIHDSYIVPDRSPDKGELMEGMAATLRKFVGDNRDYSTGYPKSIPQYGGGSWSAGDPSLPALGVAASGPVGSPPRGCIVVFFPELQQPDFFGSNALAVPISHVLGWRAGIAPLGTQKALRHEMRRRGLRHADVAKQVGISRPQFENILQGRFGASPDVAARIRKFLIEGAKTVGTSA